MAQNYFFQRVTHFFTLVSDGICAVEAAIVDQWKCLAMLQAAASAPVPANKATATATATPTSKTTTTTNGQNKPALGIGLTEDQHMNDRKILFVQYRVGCLDSLHADGRHAYDAVQVGPNPVYKASRKVLRGVDKVRPGAEREGSNLGGHHV